jgi:hypothetical protein
LELLQAHKNNKTKKKVWETLNEVGFSWLIQGRVERILPSILISPNAIYLICGFIKINTKNYVKSLTCSHYVNLIVSDIHLKKRPTDTNNRNHDQQFHITLEGPSFHM